MVSGINIFHVLAALGAAGCLYAIMQEARGRLLRPAALFPAPVLALFTSALLLMMAPPDLQTVELWVTGLLVGSFAGGVRGATMELQVDREFNLLRLPHSHDGWWCSIVLLAIGAVATLLDVVLPPTAPMEILADMAAAAGSAVCTGFLSGRAVVVYLRHHRAPHFELARL